MLTPPALSSDTIAGFVQGAYGLSVQTVLFLPIGTDVDVAVYRVDAADGKSFLKVRRRNFDPITVAGYLHEYSEHGIMAPVPMKTGHQWAHGFWRVMYPFVEGHNAYDAALSTLGQILKAVHTIALPELRYP